MSKNVKIEIEGKFYEFPVLEGSEKEKAFDISKLRDQSGYITMDNGFANTSTCKSSITFLDGEKGILHYRGYPIEQLAEKSNFLEVAFLLIYDHLPWEEEFHKFKTNVQNHYRVEELQKILRCVSARCAPNGHVECRRSCLLNPFSKRIQPHKKEHVKKYLQAFRCLPYSVRLGIPPRQRGAESASKNGR